MDEPPVAPVRIQRGMTFVPMKLRSRKMAVALFVLLNALWVLALTTGFVLFARNERLWRLVLFDGLTVSETNYQFDPVRMVVRPLLISGACLLTLWIGFYVVAAASMICVQLLFTPEIATNVFRRVRSMRANDRLWQFTFRKMERFFSPESVHNKEPGSHN